MNSISTLNLGLWEKIATILDVIPKLVYMLYACVASAVDALQALIRKLAGLDVYYQTISGNTNLVASTDPLTEFIYGILGFGDSAPVYQALNTVFWSFAIFGVIILAVTTMAAIIKSHYSEDSQQTSPWKYLYTAGKAIVTFAIIPVVVIIGLQITSFVLKTLDKITAGSTSESEVRTMFGANATNNILQSQTLTYEEAGDTGTENVTYSNYDLFGSGAPSSTTTFSGMLFKAAAYNSNRIRTGAYSISQAQGLIVINGAKLLGAEDSDFPSSGSEDEQKEYIASQVDYLFENNVYLKSSCSYAQLVSNSNGVAPVWSVTDWWGPNAVNSFTKFNVSTVWIFYDLWTFNYIVGFVGVMTIFSIMISIVLGMMSRLIKGAALFLVYPALLGIAPLDNFKAFKSWGTNFMQQLMMAFGAIVGINLLMLILPYVQSINFFNIPVVDVIVQLIMLITGLLMAKEFIGIVNGFVGGADAMGAGEGFKGSIGGKLKAGIKPVANIAGTGVRVAAKGAKMGINTGIAAGKTVAKSIAAGTAAKRANKAAKKQEKNQSLANDQRQIMKNIVGTMQSGGRGNGLSKGKAQKFKRQIDETRDKEYDKARKLGHSHDDAMRLANTAAEKKAQEIARKHNVRGYKDRQKLVHDYQETADKAQLKQERIKEKYKLHQNDDGTYSRTKDTTKIQASAFLEIPKALGKSALDIGMAMGDGLLKTVKNSGSLFGLDKALSGAKEVLGESLSYKGGPLEEYAKKKKENKEKVEATERDTKAATTQSEIAAQTKAQSESLSDIASSMKSLLKATQDSSSAQRATQKSVDNLSRTLRNNANNNTNNNGSGNP